VFRLTTEQIDDLCHLALMTDREIRSDLSIGFIKDENDYTSNFTGALRRNINCYSGYKIQATSYNLPKSIEQQTGSDATIIIQSNGFSKIVFFEAKWPRMKQVGYKWDYKQTSSGLSHFSDQLDRQSIHSGHIAFFEMLYCEYELGVSKHHMQPDGSTCIWHDDALTFKNNRASPDGIWSQSDIENMLKINSLTISDILREVCLCHKGRPYQTSNSNGLIEEMSLSGDILVITYNDQ
jgi:hypothetical protein